MSYATHENIRSDNLRHNNIIEYTLNTISNNLIVVPQLNNTELKVIKYNKTKYYQVDDQVYKINKDKSIGQLFGIFKNDEIIEISLDSYC